MKIDNAWLDMSMKEQNIIVMMMITIIISCVCLDTGEMNYKSTLWSPSNRINDVFER